MSRRGIMRMFTSAVYRACSVDSGRAGTPATTALAGTFPDNHGACCHHGLFPDADTFANNRADTDIRSVSDTHTAGENRPRRDMDVCTDLAIVLYDGTGVDDRVLTHTRIRVDDRTSQDDRSLLNLSRGSDDGRGVNNRNSGKARRNRP